MRRGCGHDRETAARAGRSRCIGLIVLDSANPFFAEIARGVEERANLAGLAVLLANSDHDPDRESSYIDLFREQRVSGVLLTPSESAKTAARHLADSGIPLVLVDEELAGGTAPSVAVDDIEGGILAVSHLLARGRRRIAYVGGPLAIRQVADRLEGARRALLATPDASLEVIEMDALTVLNGRDAGEEIARRPADERPDAVFCANELLAVGLLQGAAILGEVRVPEDLAIIGYDDIDFAQATVVPLSSIRQPARAIGAAAVELRLESIASPHAAVRHVRFQPELVSRASTWS